MCNCILILKNLIEACRNADRTQQVVYVNDAYVKTKCFAYTLVAYINIDPIANSLLPSKMVVNGEPLLIRYGSIEGSTFCIRPNMEVIIEE